MLAGREGSEERTSVISEYEITSQSNSEIRASEMMCVKGSRYAGYLGPKDQSPPQSSSSRVPLLSKPFKGRDFLCTIS